MMLRFFSRKYLLNPILSKKKIKMAVKCLSDKAGLFLFSSIHLDLFISFFFPSRMRILDNRSRF